MTNLDDIQIVNDVQELTQVSDFSSIDQKTIDNLCDKTGLLWETTSSPWQNTVISQVYNK